MNTEWGTLASVHLSSDAYTPNIFEHCSKIVWFALLLGRNSLCGPGWLGVFYLCTRIKGTIMPDYNCVLNNFAYNKVEIFVHYKRGDANPRNGRVSKIRKNTGAGKTDDNLSPRDSGFPNLREGKGVRDKKSKGKATRQQSKQ